MGFNQAQTLCSELERCLHAALVKLMLGLHSYLGTTNSVLWKEPVLLAPFCSSCGQCLSWDVWFASLTDILASAMVPG